MIIIHLAKVFDYGQINNRFFNSNPDQYLPPLDMFAIYPYNSS